MRATLTIEASQQGRIKNGKRGGQQTKCQMLWVMQESTELEDLDTGKVEGNVVILRQVLGKRPYGRGRGDDDTLGKAIDVRGPLSFTDKSTRIVYICRLCWNTTSAKIERNRTTKENLNGCILCISNAKKELCGTYHKNQEKISAVYTWTSSL